MQFISRVMLFSYLSAAVCLVWASLNHRGALRIVKEGTKTFVLFMICAASLSLLLYLMC